MARQSSDNEDATNEALSISNRTSGQSPMWEDVIYHQSQHSVLYFAPMRAQYALTSLDQQEMVRGTRKRGSRRVISHENSNTIAGHLLKQKDTALSYKGFR